MAHKNAHEDTQIRMCVSTLGESRKFVTPLIFLDLNSSIIIELAYSMFRISTKVLTVKFVFSAFTFRSGQNYDGTWCEH